MKKTACQHLPMVREALKTGHWDAETRRHFDACADCREEAQVRTWLVQFALSLPDETPPTITPQLIWIKAQLAERQLARKNALRPLVYIQTAIQLLLGVGFLIAAWWHWAGIDQWFRNLPAGTFNWPQGIASSGVMAAALMSIAVLFICLALLATFSTFAFRR